MISINNEYLGAKCFPNNERIIKDIKVGDEVVVDFKYNTDIDISVLMFVKKYLDDKYPSSKKILKMLYVPYSRMDRDISGYVFTLKYFCQFINELCFDEVLVLDPHSSVASGILNRVRQVNVSSYIKRICFESKVDFLFYPDDGAYKRYTEIIQFAAKPPSFFGSKIRDLATGEIIEYSIPQKPKDVEGKTVLIVDDLCCKGTTFYNAAIALKEIGFENVLLYVSHCEDSIYGGNLLKTDYVSKIFTTDSILTNWGSNKICEIS